MSTSTLGAGAAPAGGSVAGFGVPATATAPVPQSFVNGAAVAIDPVKRDYTFDANGNRNRMTSTQQLVYLAILTVRGSAGTPTMGMEPLPDVFSENTSSRVKQAVYRALLPYTSTTPALIQVVSVNVSRKPNGPMQLAVVWRDLSSRQETTTTVPLGG